VFSDGGGVSIALFGLFGVGNIGNEASLSAGIRAIRRRLPDAEIVVVGLLTDVVSEQHGVRCVSIHTGRSMPRVWGAPRPVRLLVRALMEPVRWLNIFRFLETVDGVIIPGTGILDDFGEGPQQMPYQLIVWTTLARIAGRPWSMVGVGGQSIKHPVSRWLVGRTMRNVGSVTYRDQGSLEYMTTIGVDTTSSSIQPDVVFSLPIPDDLGPNGTGAGVIGLGLMNYAGWNVAARDREGVFDGYIDSMIEITRRLLSDGFTIRILVGELGDAAAVDRLTAAVKSDLGESGVEGLTIEAIETFDDLLDQVAQTDAVVATRFHNVVASLMMSKPTVSIGYDPKNRELMAAFGLGAHCHHIDQIVVDDVLSDVEVVLRKEVDRRPGMLAINEVYRREVDEGFDQVIDRMSGRP
jgi:polysaccharide pyruvyl transferase WcaK-like protein